MAFRGGTKGKTSLRGRRSKGKRKGIRARRPRSRALKFPLPHAATQARGRLGWVALDGCWMRVGWIRNSGWYQFKQKIPLYGANLFILNTEMLPG